MKKILITGSKGLIGKKVFNYLKKKNKVYGIDKNNVDLSNEIEVKTFFKKNNNFDYLINLHGANEQVVKKKEDINLVFKNDLESFNHYFHNNVFSFYLTNKYFIKFSKNGKGIINFSSIFSLISPKHVIYDKPKNIFYVLLPLWVVIGFFMIGPLLIMAVVSFLEPNVYGGVYFNFDFCAVD